MEVRVRTAFWRRIDVPGHDACRLTESNDGFQLSGIAVFLHEGQPTALSYSVACDRAWRTVGGSVHGFIGKDRFDARIERDAAGWRMNGERVDELADLTDLDYGFTPATNLIQTSRVTLTANEPASLPAAWLDVGAAGLVRIEQTYEKRDAGTMWYEAPKIPYEAMLEMSADGFVFHYPGLWKRER